MPSSFMESESVHMVVLYCWGKWRNIHHSKVSMFTCKTHTYLLSIENAWNYHWHVLDLVNLFWRQVMSQPLQGARIWLVTEMVREKRHLSQMILMSYTCAAAAAFLLLIEAIGWLGRFSFQGLVEVVQAIQEASLEVTFFNCVFCMPFVVYCFFQVAFEHFAARRISTF
jgi:hypothetical protein